MSTGRHDSAVLPNPVVRSLRTTVRAIDVVLRVCAKVLPHKTAVEIARRTDVSPRAAEYWLQGRCGLSADALAALLRSDVGYEILEGLIGEAKPDWWRTFKRTVELSKLRALQEEQRRVIERLEREAAE